MAPDISDPQAVFAGFHQQAKHREPRVMPQGGERPGLLTGRRHGPKHNYKTSYVKRFAMGGRKPLPPTKGARRA